MCVRIEKLAAYDGLRAGGERAVGSCSAQPGSLGRKKNRRIPSRPIASLGSEKQWTRPPVLDCVGGGAVCCVLCAAVQGWELCGLFAPRPLPHPMPQVSWWLLWYALLGWAAWAVCSLRNRPPTLALALVLAMLGAANPGSAKPPNFGGMQLQKANSSSLNPRLTMA